MAGSAKRERQLAREHYQRQQQRRAAMAVRRRRTQQVVAVVVAAVLVVGGVLFLAANLGGDDGGTATASTPTASPSVSLSPSVTASPSTTASTAAGGCAYTKSSEAASKNVGLPTYDKSKAASYKVPFTATIKTNVGNIVVAMAADKAPCTTNSFKHLAQAKYFDKTSCHRLTTSGIFVLQCGDPSGTGSGGPGYQFGLENPPANGTYPAGTLAMARTSDPNSNGSQFFIVYKASSLPAPGYTIFGRVTSGLDLVSGVAAAGTDNANGTGDGKPKKPVTIESVTVGKA